MKYAAPEQTVEPYPERKSTVPANGILLALLTLGMLGLYGWQRSMPDRPNQPNPSVAKTAELNDTEWQSIASQMAEADRAFVQPPGTPDTYNAFNRSRNLAFTVSAEAVEVRPRMDASSWFVRLRYPESTGTASLVSPGVNRVEIERNGMTEWYVHREEGLEQGFTLEAPPAGQPLGEIAINLAIETSLVPRLVDGTIWFSDSMGEPVLSYEKLQAFDADGQILPAEMQLVSANNAASIRLVVDTSRATYPVVVDPLLTTTLPLTIPEGTVSVPDMSAAVDTVPGRIVALDGNTLAVGEEYYEPYSGSGPQGAVRIFYRQADGSWLLQKQIELLKASYFLGTEVSLDGDTLVVRDDDSARVDGGDYAYIFERNEGGADNWGLVEQLDPSPSIYFVGQCGAVAINGDLAFVGYPRIDDPSHWFERVVVYGRNVGGGWGILQTIEAPNAYQDDRFGNSLAVSPNGEFLLIGVPDANGGDGAALLYLSATNPGTYQLSIELPAPASAYEFGRQVAISDTSFAIGAHYQNGAESNEAVYAYDYARTGPYDSVVTSTQEILPPVETAFETFGFSLGLNTSYLCIGHAHAESGGTYQKEPLFFYRRDAGTQQWSLSRTMFDPQTNSASEFGSSFALTESRLAVAASASQEVQVYDLDGYAGDQLGASVCIEGDTVVVGANQADGLVANSGAAYVFGREAGTLEPWNLQRKIMADDGTAGDLFGISIDLSGDIVVVGAPGDGDYGLSSGAAYAFSRNFGGTGSWGQIQKFAPADTLSGDYFGFSVGIWGNRVVVGAPYHDAFGTNEGTAYLYESGVLKTNFDGFIAGPGDRLGFSVSIDGDFVVAGAPYNGYNAGVTKAGVAIVFKRDSASGNWSEYSTLFHGSPGTGDQLGWSVSLSGGHVVVGAPFRDEGGLVDSGAAFVYSLTPFLPPVDKVLVPYNPGAGNQFGSAVALGGTRLAVGASGSGSYSYPGSAYLFDQNHDGAGNWGQAMKRTPADGGGGDLFGYMVAVDGDSTVVGAPWHDGPLADSGAAYFYAYEPNYSPTNITLVPDSVYEGKPVGTVVGELAASDPDALDQHAFALVAGNGDADNASFAVDGLWLRTAAVFDYETRTSYQIRVRATDQDGAFFEKALTVQILDVPASEEDSDADGMPDWWELDNFGNPTNAAADGNPDFDPFGNLDEYIAGSDPNGSNSYLRITNAAPGSVGFFIEWAPCTSGRRYGVFWVDDLGNGTSSLGQTDFPQNSYTDTVHGTERTGFYKVDVWLK